MLFQESYCFSQDFSEISLRTCTTTLNEQLIVDLLAAYVNKSYPSFILFVQGPALTPRPAINAEGVIGSRNGQVGKGFFIWN